MDKIRQHILDNYEDQIASSFSCVEILDALYGVTCDPILGPQDIFIMSKGHAAGAHYIILAMKGIIPWEDLPKYGYYTNREAPGMPFTTGSLGCGLGLACGVALAKKLKGESGTVYVLLGDGELYEGSVLEGIRFAFDQQLGNLVVLVDANGVACIKQDIESPEYMFDAAGWDIRTISPAVTTIIRFWIDSDRERNYPSAYIIKTTKGKGLPELEADPLRHVRKVIDGKVV